MLTLTEWHLSIKLHDWTQRTLDRNLYGLREGKNLFQWVHHTTPHQQINIIKLYLLYTNTIEVIRWSEKCVCVRVCYGENRNGNRWAWLWFDATALFTASAKWKIESSIAIGVYYIYSHIVLLPYITIQNAIAYYYRYNSWW